MQKLTGQSSHVVGRPYCMGDAVSTPYTAIKNLDEKKICVVHNMRYKRMVLSASDGSMP
jgi:hypothetical protein